jgi:DNA polymerase III gamma/tau subunit
MIATTHSISQLPATIASRAMIFHVDRLSDDEMKQWLIDYKPNISSSMFEVLIQLADGRP